MWKNILLIVLAIVVIYLVYWMVKTKKAAAKANSPIVEAGKPPATGMNYDATKVQAERAKQLREMRSAEAKEGEVVSVPQANFGAAVGA